MYLGGNDNNANNNFSLSLNELNNINTSNTATLYLGDYNTISNNINIIYIFDLNFQQYICNKLYINSLFSANNGGNIIIENNTNTFEYMDVTFLSSKKISLIKNSSVLLTGSTLHTLYFDSNENCNNNDSILFICNGCNINVAGGAKLEIYINNITIDGILNSSDITLSEKCSSTYSIAIGGNSPPSDGNT